MEDLERLERRNADLERRLRELNAVKHEMSNVLMGLMGHAELLAGRPDLSAAVREKVDHVFKQAKRMQAQLDQLAKIGRPDDGDAADD